MKDDEYQRECGIYKITNKINGKVYIGQSINIKRRWQEHKNHTKQKNNQSKLLYAAMEKFGIENFSFEIIERCSKEDLNKREKYYIDFYNSCKNGYNMQIGNNYSKNVSNKQIEELIYLLENENISQNEIANRLNISKTYVSRFNKGFIRHQQNLIYPIRETFMCESSHGNKEKELFENVKNRNELKIKTLKTKRNYCIECGKEISKKAKRCVNCENKGREYMSVIEERISRDELKDLIRTTSFTAIGEIYGVSDNAIRKWCIHYNLPRTKKIIKSYSDEEWKNL